MKPTPQYQLTPEFFERRRQSLEKRQAELHELLEQLHAINEQIEQLRADEKLAAELAARYPADIVVELPKKRGPHRRPTPSRPVPSGRPWTPEEEAAVMAGDAANDEALAQRLDRKGPGVIAKRRRKILRAGGAGKAHAEPGPTPPPEPEEATPSPPEPVYAQTDSIAEDPLEGVSWEPASSEKPEIPTNPASTDGERRVPRPLPKLGPVRTVTGMLVDNGPQDKRVYPAGFESREH